MIAVKVLGLKIKNFKKFDYICNKIMANEGSKNHKSDITFLD